MAWSSQDLKVAAFAERLLVEFPEWSMTQAVVAAERIVEAAQAMGAEADRRRDRLEFIRATRRDVALLPETEERP